MHEEFIEDRGTYKGHRWGVKFMASHGYRCGYVEVPESLNKLKSNLEDLSVHGGVTYIEHLNPLDYMPTKNLWIGFDCAHAGDGLGCPPEAFEGLFQGEVRSLEYCVKECEKLIDQLIELEERSTKED